MRDQFDDPVGMDISGRFRADQSMYDGYTLVAPSQTGRRAKTKANGITVRSPIGSSKNAVNLGCKDEPELNGASSCVPTGGLR